MSAAVTWTSAKVPIVSGDQSTPIDGWLLDAVPTLAINNFGGRHWGVTHVPSGWSIARWFQTRGAAEALVLAIAPLGEWSRSADQLRQDEQLADRVWPIRAEIHAREERGDFGPVDQGRIAEWNRFETRLEEAQRTRELGMKVRSRRIQQHPGGR